MKEILICQICKEPIHNFVCIDRLADDIGKWLPSDLSSHFAGFNKQFLGIFSHTPHADLGNHHIVCNSEFTSNICLHCYVNEVFQWLAGKNKAVANRFRRLFSFGMDKKDFREVMLARPRPIMEMENMGEEFGICDECGEYTDELKLLNGRWVCQECGGD